MKNKEFDGSIENFDAVLADTPIGNRFDQDNFYPANGMVIKYQAVLADTPLGNVPDQDNFYPANGLFGGKLQRKFKGTILDKKERAKRRKERVKTQREQAKAQTEAAKSIAKSSEGDKALINALSKEEASLSPEKGMSTQTKILIGVGLAAVLGIGAYFLIKRNKNK